METYYPPQNTFGQSYGRQEPPRYDLCFVDGRDGAMRFEMGPRSKVLLPDKNESVVWYVETDGFGHKTVCDAYDMILRAEPKPVDSNELIAMIQSLSDKIHNLEVQLGVESAMESSTSKPAK